MAVAYAGDHTTSTYTIQHVGGWQLTNQQVNTTLIFIRTGRMGVSGLPFCPQQIPLVVSSCNSKKDPKIETPAIGMKPYFSQISLFLNCVRG